MLRGDKREKYGCPHARDEYVKGGGKLLKARKGVQGDLGDGKAGNASRQLTTYKAGTRRGEEILADSKLTKNSI